MSSSIDSALTGKEIDLDTLLALLWARRWLIVGCVVLFGGAAALVAVMMTPVYRAAIVVLPAEVERGGVGALGGSRGDLGGLAALVGINVGSNNHATEEALAVLRSRAFTEDFITARNLLPLLFHKKWNAEAKRWNVDEDAQPTMAQGFKYFSQGVRTISRDTATGLVTVRIDWRDPVEAADWANDLVTRLNAEMRGRAIARTDASVGYLEKELTTTVIVDTRAAISRLMEAQINERMLANVTQEYAFRVVDKALPPDADDPIRPQKPMIALSGALVGFILAVTAAIISFRRRRP